MDRELLKDMGLLATPDQLDYIDDLLERAGVDLEDYNGGIEREWLTKEEASDIIDELKEDLGYD